MFIYSLWQGSWKNYGVMGVDIYTSFKHEMFRMHVALMWTSSDYPGLGNLLCLNIYIRCACVHCNYDSEPYCLSHSRKKSFMGHRCFLNSGYKFIMSKIKYNGEQKLCNPPWLPSDREIFNKLTILMLHLVDRWIINISGKKTQCKYFSRRGITMEEKSIFFVLLYWEHNLLCHNLDVMHIVKNACDNVLFIFLNDGSRSQDHLNACKELKDMSCKPNL